MVNKYDENQTWDDYDDEDMHCADYHHFSSIFQKPQNTYFYRGLCVWFQLHFIKYICNLAEIHNLIDPEDRFPLYSMIFLGADLKLV